MAILITGVLIASAQLLDLKILAEAASTVLIFNNILACVAVIVLRESGLQNYRPIFRTPLYPWVQIAGILGLTFLLLEMGEDAYFISAVLVFAAFCGYWFYGRKRNRQESAFLHLVNRLMARDLASGSLEDELKQVVREREGIAADRFDGIIENSLVLDLNSAVDLDAFFEQVADRLADRLNLPADKLKEAFWKRERESTTAFHPDLAIPHIVVGGEGRFDILLARVKEGIRFHEKAPHVRAVFVIIGTRDQRSYHLTALAAIAQVVRDHEFMKRWLAAPNEQALRDVVLLGQRLREGGRESATC